MGNGKYASSTIKINIDEIEKEISKYLKRVEQGETIVVIKQGKPVAELRPVISEHIRFRPFGLCSGEFSVPDDFDAPLPESIIADFETK